MPTNAIISHNTITNANTRSKSGIGAITLLQSNSRGISITYNDISASFNGIAIEFTLIAGIAANTLGGTGDDLTFYNIQNNYWGSGIKKG